MKRPSPKSILMADVVRDGGSYFLIFRGEDGRTYSLHMQVTTRAGEPTSYQAPILGDQESGVSASLSWAESAVLAKELFPLLLPSIAEGGAKRASEIVALMGQEGRANAS